MPQGGRGRSFELIRDRQRQTSRVERAGSIGEEGEGTSFCEGGRIVPAKLASLHEGRRRHEPPSFLPSFLPCTLENNYPSRIERNNVGSFFLFFLISPRVIYPIWPIDHPPPLALAACKVWQMDACHAEIKRWWRGHCTGAVVKLRHRAVPRPPTRLGPLGGAGREQVLSGDRLEGTRKGEGT